MKTIRVVAAVIYADGKVFATQRGYGDFKGGWEFPGGKIEEGETPENALKREISEELETEIAVGELIETIANDEEDTIVLIRKSGEETLAMIFNCGSSTKEFDEYAQKYDLLTDSVFDGKVEGFGAAVIVLA